MQQNHDVQQHSENQQIELEMLRIFHRRILLCSNGAIASVIFIGFFIWYFSLIESHLNAWFWNVALVLAYSVGYLIKYRFDQQNQVTLSVKRWRGVFMLYSLICGLSWSFGIAYVCWYADGINIAVVIAVLLCVCSVSVSLVMSQLYAVWLFMTATMLPPAVCLLLKQTLGESLVGMLVLLGLFLLLIVGKIMHKSLYGQLHTEIQLRRAVSEAQQAREQADQANNFKSQFLANVSHEIRTPMNAVLGMLKLLQYTELTERQWDYVLKGEGAAKAMLGLLNDILDFSKIEAGKVVLDMQPLHLSNFMQELMELLQTYAAQKPIQLRLELDPTAPEAVLSDPLRLRQILMNLGSNAIKFTNEGTVILRVRVLTQDQNIATLSFEVQDNGIGIAPEKQNQIFEEFTQAESTTASRFGGTGLGLSISKQLVKAMGGNIKLQSDLGKGSTFSFDLRIQTFRWNADTLKDNGDAYWPTRAVLPR